MSGVAPANARVNVFVEVPFVDERGARHTVGHRGLRVDTYRKIRDLDFVRREWREAYAFGRRYLRARRGGAVRTGCGCGGRRR